MCRTARTTVEHQPETAICSCSWSRTLAAVFNTKTQIPSGKWNLITSAYLWNIRYASWQQVWTAVNLVWTGCTTETHSIVQTHSTTYTYVLSDKNNDCPLQQEFLSPTNECNLIRLSNWAVMVKYEIRFCYCLLHVSAVFKNIFWCTRKFVSRAPFVPAWKRTSQNNPPPPWLEGLPTALWLF